MGRKKVEKKVLENQKEIEKKALSGDISSIKLLLENAASNKDFEKIVYWCGILVTYDDPSGHYLLGICYRDGSGVRKSPKKAFENFKAASDLGHIEARFNLGKCYVEGFGVNQDIKIGLDLMEKTFYELDKLLINTEKKLQNITINNINNYDTTK